MTSPNFKSLPKLRYSGLTIVLNRLSRFDNAGPITGGYAAHWFDQQLQRHGMSRFQCDIRLAKDTSPYREGTKVVLFLGEEALHTIKPEVSLNEQRGSPFMFRDKLIGIASYAPQDTCDLKNYEGKYHGDGETSDSEEESEESIKSHGKTPRGEFRFWLTADLSKSIRILQKGLNIPAHKAVLYPSFDEITSALRIIKQENLYADIETRTDGSLAITCISVATDTSPVYTIPFLRYNDTYAYDKPAEILRSLAIAFRDNTVVIWNAMFDLFVFCWKYRLPPPRLVYDGMLAMQRCFPECRKSLGHGISYFTDLPYHKNTAGTFNPNTPDQDKQLWEYNNLDVYSMREVKFGIDRYAAKITGLPESIAQANRAVIPYLTSTLQGLRLDAAALEAKMLHHDRRRNQMLRMLRYLVGYDLNPNSPKQVKDYLYKELGHKCPDPDNPTNEKTLMKLLCKVECPAVHVILEYRGLAKEQGTIKCKPWTGRNPDFDFSEPRITCAWKLGGTITFRRGSSILLKQKGTFETKREAPLSWGTNMANWSK